MTAITPEQLIAALDALETLIVGSLDDNERLRMYAKTWETAFDHLRTVDEAAYHRRRALEAERSQAQRYSIIGGYSGRVIGRTVGFQGLADVLDEEPKSTFRLLKARKKVAISTGTD